MKTMASLALAFGLALAGCSKQDTSAAPAAQRNDAQQFVPKQEMQFKR